MRKLTVITIVVSMTSLLIASCGSGHLSSPTYTPAHTNTLTPTSTPTYTPRATSTASPTPARTPTRTPVPPTPSPTPSLDPRVPLQTPSPGQHFGDWSWAGTIQVWATNLTLIGSDFGSPQEKETGAIWQNHLWDPNKPWFFAGQGTGDFILLFDKPYTDFVIATKTERDWLVDYIAGIVIYGDRLKEVPMNWTLDGNGQLVPSTWFADTARGPQAKSVLDAEFNLPHTLVERCGIVGPEPDENYTVFVSGAMLGRLPQGSFDYLNQSIELWGDRGLHPHKLVGMHIVAIPYDDSKLNQICR